MGIRKKFMVAFLVILFLGGALMMTWFYCSLHEDVRYQAIQGANILSDSIHGAVYGFMKTGQQSDLEAYLEKGSKLQSVDEIRVIRSALLEKELGAKKSGYVMDNFEQRALQSKQVMRKTVVGGRGEAVSIVSPIIAEKSCTACHAGVQEGDVMALLRTTLVFQPSIDALRRDFVKAGFMQILIFLIVIGATFMLLNRFMINPLSSLAVIVDRVSNADLTQEVKVRSHDEIGSLALRFNNMTAGLKNIIKKVQEATHQITSASNQIFAASQDQASTAREQSSAVAETASAARQLSTTSVQVGESIKKVAQVASHAMAGMAKIRESIDRTNGMLSSLGEKSQQIGALTKLIDDVADRTNLLAVNAAIEAARAGEQGHGFTVVAGEIRKLADSTEKSTKDITALVELIQHEMSNAIMSMAAPATSCRIPVTRTRSSTGGSHACSARRRPSTSSSAECDSRCTPMTGPRCCSTTATRSSCWMRMVCRPRWPCPITPAPS